MFYLSFIYLVVYQLIYNKIENRRLRDILGLLPLVLIIVFRFGLGPDYFSYQYIYENLPIGNFGMIFNYENHIDIGYKILMFVFRNFNVTFHLYFTILNLITLFIFYKWLKDNSEYFPISLVLFYTMFFFVWVLSSVRQGIVIAISMYLFFNKKKQISPIKGFIAIILLGTIHKSALFVFVLLLLGKREWKKNDHLYFLGISVLSTLLPVAWIVEKFAFLSPVKWIVDRYMTSSIGFLDISSLMRLFFFSIIFIFYDHIADDNYSRKIVNTSLIGFSLYFLLKFSELTASRATVYSFMLVLLIIPLIWQRYLINKKPQLVSIGVIGLGLFQATYLQKELIAMRNHSFMLSNSFFVPMETVFDKDYSKFNSQHSFLLSQKKISSEEKDDYVEFHKLRSDVDYSEDDTFLVVNQLVEGRRQYGIINQDGDWLRRPFASRAIYVFGEVLMTQEYKGFFTYQSFEDLGNQNLTNDEMESVVSEYLYNDSIKSNLYEEPLQVGDEVIVSPFKEYFNNPDGISNIYMSKINEPFEYYIVRVVYNGVNYYYYLDENKYPINEILSTSVDSFSQDGYLKISSYSGNLFINKEGKIIWWE